MFKKAQLVSGCLPPSERYILHFIHSPYSDLLCFKTSSHLRSLCLHCHRYIALDSILLTSWTSALTFLHSSKRRNKSMRWQQSNESNSKPNSSFIANKKLVKSRRSSRSHVICNKPVSTLAIKVSQRHHRNVVNRPTPPCSRAAIDTRLPALPHLLVIQGVVAPGPSLPPHLLSLHKPRRIMSVQTCCPQNQYRALGVAQMIESLHSYLRLMDLHDVMLLRKSRPCLACYIPNRSWIILILNTAKDEPVFYACYWLERPDSRVRPRERN